MSNAKDRNQLGADYSHPYAPPIGRRWLFCYACFDDYVSTDMKWDGANREWRCRNWPWCDGTGYGVDIVEHEDQCDLEWNDDAGVDGP